MSVYDPGHQTTKADKPQATENSVVEAPLLEFLLRVPRPEKRENCETEEKEFLFLYT